MTARAVTIFLLVKCACVRVWGGGSTAALRAGPGSSHRRHRPAKLPLTEKSRAATAGGRGPAQLARGRRARLGCVWVCCRCFPNTCIPHPYSTANISYARSDAYVAQMISSRSRSPVVHNWYGCDLCAQVDKVWVSAHVQIVCGAQITMIGDRNPYRPDVSYLMCEMVRVIWYMPA